jgi:hypothetical protein
MAGTSRSDRAARLLLRALDTLTPAEKRVVLEALLTGSIGGLAVAFDRPSFPSGTSRQMEQPLLVRLPSDLHRRFRKWTTDNGFTMAAVARGLVERFLDEQDRAASA